MQSYSYAHELQVVDGTLYMKIGVGSGAQSSLYQINLELLRSEKIIAAEKYPIWNFHALSNGNILFSGQYRNEDGIYIYDPATKKFTTLISKRDADRGRNTYTLSLSPDENHILIHDVVDQDEISSAELKEGQLLNRITVMKGYPLPAIIGQLKNTIRTPGYPPFFAEAWYGYGLADEFGQLLTTDDEQIEGKLRELAQALDAEMNRLRSEQEARKSSELHMPLAMVVGAA